MPVVAEARAERGPDNASANPDRPARRLGRLLRRAMALAAVLALAFLALTPTGCYLSRAGWEEAKILKHRRPIARLVEDSAIDPATRAKLRLVLQARRFAADSIGLTAKQSFTTYSRLDRDTLVLVLSAAYRDRLQFYTWWFPIVGHVPYKGFFDFGAARQAARDLEARGLDAYLRPSPAFSTLGWFNDPVLSTSLHADSLELVNTVVHELTHNTFYAKSAAVFNESFANFVGARGAAWYFRAQGDDSSARRTDDRWEDEKLLGHFWTRVYHEVDSAYKQHPSDSAARVAARDEVFARSRRRLIDSVAPAFRTISPRYAERVRLDNAALMAQRIYLTGLDELDAVYAREGGDLRRALARIIALAKERPKEPLAAIQQWLSTPASR